MPAGKPTGTVQNLSNFIVHLTGSIPDARGAREGLILLYIFIFYFVDFMHL